MDVVRIKGLLHCQKHVLCGVELHERSDWRTRFLDIHWSFLSYSFLSIHCKPYTQLYIPIWCTTTHKQQNSRWLWLHTTYQTMALLSMMHHSVRTNLPGYTTCHSVFPNSRFMYDNIKINHWFVLLYCFIASTKALVHCHEFAAGKCAYIVRGCNVFITWLIFWGHLTLGDLLCDTGHFGNSGTRV